MRAALTILVTLVWLALLAVAMLTIIPWSAMGLARLFSGDAALADRVQALGLIAIGLLVVGVLALALSRLTRFFFKAFHAQDR